MRVPPAHHQSLGLSMVDLLLNGRYVELFRETLNSLHIAMVLLTLKRKKSRLPFLFSRADISYRPMWYSWRGHDESSSSHGPRTKSSDTHNLPTILNQSQNLYGDDFAPLPVSLHLDILWPVFLKNVHPLVKIFFDWEVAPIVEQAQRDAATLRIEEVALLNAIRFIATLTLTQEECQRSLSEPKHDFLPHCQRNVEYALIKAQYSESTDKRVLQAFMLYIVSENAHCHAVPP